MNELKQIKEDFKRIKNLGFIADKRTNNRDGGIGNTYEDLLGVKENNLTVADYLGYEVKSKRKFNSSYVSLFCKTPSFPKSANAYLREKYGENREANSTIKKLYASIFANRHSLIYSKYKMKLVLDYQKQQLLLDIKDLALKHLDAVYWTFDELEKASRKIKSLLLVLAEEKEENNKRWYHYNEAEIYYDFDFAKLLESIELGNIMFDIRIGAYNSGKNIGKTHDHGSGFRIKRENLKTIYHTYEKI